MTKVQLEFDLNDRTSRVALRAMLYAIETMDSDTPERRQDSSDNTVLGAATADTLAEVAAERGDIDVDGAKPAQVNGGDPEAPPEGPIARAARRGRKAAPAVEEPPQPPTEPPVDGKTDVSGPDEETVAPHSILNDDPERRQDRSGSIMSIDTIEKDGVGRSKITGRKHELSVTEAREIAVKHLREVFTTGGPKAKSEVAAYQRELGLKAFSDVPDERAYDMYRRSIEMMHAIGKSA